jgi:hypothetical protein
MNTTVVYSEDPSTVLAVAGDYLRSDPVPHNVILSLLQQRVENPQPGRYWVASQGGIVAGVMFQSPVDFIATLTPMAAEVVTAVVDAVVDSGAALPGVSGEVATAAKFAGQWTERTKSAAVPEQGLRIYEAEAVRKPAEVSGYLRQAKMEDRDLVIRWLRAFHEDIGQHGHDRTANVDRRLRAATYRIWENGEPVSLARSVLPVEGVVRIGAVYTPPAHRRRGYAGACVAELTESILERGYRAILYTDLGNPVSNSIYRRIAGGSATERWPRICSISLSRK